MQEDSHLVVDHVVVQLQGLQRGGALDGRQKQKTRSASHIPAQGRVDWERSQSRGGKFARTTTGAAREESQALRIEFGEETRRADFGRSFVLSHSSRNGPGQHYLRVGSHSWGVGVSNSAGQRQR